MTEEQNNAGKNRPVVTSSERDKKVEEHIRGILEYLGEDPDREGLIGTPERIVRMWKEIFRGYDPQQKPKITVFKNGCDGIVYDDMIIDEGEFYSVCEHHMMPFFGRYWFAYIPNPNGRILGISKIGRVIDYCAAKLQIQERLAHEVVDMLAEALKDEEYPPLGIALVMKASHLCKEMRGVRKHGDMTSGCLTGAFKEDRYVRTEFLDLIKK